MIEDLRWTALFAQDPKGQICSNTRRNKAMINARLVVVLAALITMSCQSRPELTSVPMYLIDCGTRFPAAEHET